jgi:hypothetical protein
MLCPPQPPFLVLSSRPPTPFRAKQADFFFPFHSCENLSSSSPSALFVLTFGCAGFTAGYCDFWRRMAKSQMAGG